MLSFFTLAACDSMLEVENDSTLQDPDLNNKTDSVFYALGIAQAIQQVADQYFFVGEMRGELVTTTTSTSNHLRQLANYSATTANKYDSAYVYYKVINNCNYYLANRDTTLYTGATNVTLNEYAAVAAWRAWAYLQLARTYGGEEQGIPFFTEPLTALSQINEDNFPKLTISQIVAELAPSLERFSGYEVPTFGSSSYSIGTTNWSGSTKNIAFQHIFVPVDVILGEMYLEDGQWIKAAQYYAKYLCDNQILPNLLGSIRGDTGGGSMFGEDGYPSDFGSFNSVYTNYASSVYASTASPTDMITYIPMAVSQQNGTITSVPEAFGLDYYSTTSSSTIPLLDEIQIVPSETYSQLTRNAAYYYYPTIGTQTSPDTVKIWNRGDGRASYTTSERSMSSAVMYYPAEDTTMVYVTKMRNANIYLFRESTIWLHLAEALNRAGYPDAAFAILRNGISTYLEDLVPGAGDVHADYQYVTSETIDLLTNVVPFLNATNRNVYVPESVYGIHAHGACTYNSRNVEEGRSVSGSAASALGSTRNLHYLPSVIIGEKLQEIASQFNVTVGTTKEDSINAMEDILVDEYAKEFAFEGNRFYDLQRVARHKNEAALYSSDFGSQWFAKKLENNNPTVSLLDPKNWYMPFK